MSSFGSFLETFEKLSIKGWIGKIESLVLYQNIQCLRWHWLFPYKVDRRRCSKVVSRFFRRIFENFASAKLALEFLSPTTQAAIFGGDLKEQVLVISHFISISLLEIPGKNEIYSAKMFTNIKMKFLTLAQAVQQKYHCL